MRQFIYITKALADESRVRILAALKGRELCVCQLTELLALAPSTVSKHLSILKNVQFIGSRKKGRWTFYRLAGDEAPPEIREGLEWIFRTVADSSRIAADTRKLTDILKIDPEVLCSRLSKSGNCESR
jgi:ArsR family transcriptional regulator